MRLIPRVNIIPPLAAVYTRGDAHVTCGAL